MKIGIIADDLTSATDGAAPFVASGHACDVCLDARLAPAEIADVVAIDKDSRSRTREEAVLRAQAATRQLAQADLLFHTVDSTIRGHLESEILATLHASGRKAALLAPAFPEAGRTTIDGMQWLHGEALSHTAYARDPIHPVTEHRLRYYFRSVNDSAIRHLSLAEVRSQAPNGHLLSNEELIIADAEQQADLDQLVASIANPREILFCGSPGMAKSLAARFQGAGVRPLAISPAFSLLTVLGSANEISLAQKHRLIAMERTTEILIDARLASSSPFMAMRAAIDRARLNATGMTSLVIGTGFVERTGVEPRRVTEAIGLAAAEIIRSHPIDGMILTGGDTAAAVFRMLMVGRIGLAGEVEPGIPIGWIDMPRRMSVITKAGGFGDPDTLLRCAAKLLGAHVGACA